MITSRNVQRFQEDEMTFLWVVRNLALVYGHEMFWVRIWNLGRHQEQISLWVLSPFDVYLLSFYFYFYFFRQGM